MNDFVFVMPVVQCMVVMAHVYIKLQLDPD